MYSTNTPQKLNLKASKNISFHQDSCQDQQDLLVSAGHHCLFTLYSTSHIYIPSKQNRPKQQHQPTEACLCEGAFGLQKLCQIVDGDEGVRMHGAQLIFSPRQGPAIELLRLQGGLWMGDSRVASYAVARWALCCDPQLVRGNVLLVQCGTLIVQTPKPANLRIWSA